MSEQSNRRVVKARPIQPPPDDEDRPTPAGRKSRLVLVIAVCVLAGFVLAGGGTAVFVWKQREQERAKQTRMDADYFKVIDHMFRTNVYRSYADEWSSRTLWNTPPVFDAGSGSTLYKMPGVTARGSAELNEKWSTDARSKFASAHHMELADWGNSFAKRYPNRRSLLDQGYHLGKRLAADHYFRYIKGAEAAVSKQASTEAAADARWNYCRSESDKMMSEVESEIGKFPERLEMADAIASADGNSRQP